MFVLKIPIYQREGLKDAKGKFKLPTVLYISTSICVCDVHSKRWLKYTFSTFLCKKLKKTKER